VGLAFELLAKKEVLGRFAEDKKIEYNSYRIAPRSRYSILELV